MPVSDNALYIIKDFEGLRLDAYKDSAGVWTIGYGHTGAFAYPGNSITKSKAETLLRADANTALGELQRLVTVPLNQNQKDALTSFVFNIGGRQFADSTLLKKLNKGDYKGAAREFPRWKYAGGKILNGLVKRRAKEQALFKKKKNNTLKK